MSSIARLVVAVEAGDVEGVRTLLATNPELVQARDATGATALHYAAFHGHQTLVDLLCAAGGDLNARDARHDATPTGWAIHYLRERGGLLSIEIEDVLHAIRTRDVSWVKRLVARHPALVHAADASGKPLLDHAQEVGDAAIVRLFKIPASGA